MNARPIKDGEIAIEPLACESLGIRSLATFVVTPDIKLILDPGLSHGIRSRLPHPKEAETLISCGRKLMERAVISQVLTISHYHFDHYMPSFSHWMNFASAELCNRLYQNKDVLLKSKERNINLSQRKRAYYMFQRRDCNLKVADGRLFKYGDTVMKFSEPVDHGEAGTRLGKVLLCTIATEHERFLFAPDIQGPMVESTLSYIFNEDPDLLLLGGPPLYLTGKVTQESFNKARKNLIELARRIPRVIVDHHLLRDPGWKDFLHEAKEAATARGHELVCAAQFLGEEIRDFEAHRDELYENEPPSSDWEDKLKGMKYSL